MCRHPCCVARVCLHTLWMRGCSHTHVCVSRCMYARAWFAYAHVCKRVRVACTCLAAEVYFARVIPCAHIRVAFRAYMSDCVCVRRARLSVRTRARMSAYTHVSGHFCSEMCICMRTHVRVHVCLDVFVHVCAGVRTSYYAHTIACHAVYTQFCDVLCVGVCACIVCLRGPVAYGSGTRNQSDIFRA